MNVWRVRACAARGAWTGRHYALDCRVDPALQRNPLARHCPLIVLVEERNAFGVAKYGQPLMTQDGRNGIEDARQELCDLVSTAVLVMRQLIKKRGP